MELRIAVVVATDFSSLRGAGYSQIRRGGGQGTRKPRRRVSHGVVNLVSKSGEALLEDHDEASWIRQPQIPEP